MLKILKTMFGVKIEDASANRRTAIKSQKDPNELELTPAEKTIADAYDKLPRACRREIERSKPEGWIDLKEQTDLHTPAGHGHG